MTTVYHNYFACWCAQSRTIISDSDGVDSSSSEDGSELISMEVNIPPDLARELGQDPGVSDREREDEDEKLTAQKRHKVAAREDSATEDTEGSRLI